MNPLRLQNPEWLLLWIPLALLTLAAGRRRARSAAMFSDTSLAASMPRTLALRLKPWLRRLRPAGLALAIFALARPQFGWEDFRIRTEGIAIQMCIDRSGSMHARDFSIDGRQVSRLEAVKQVFHDFVEGRGSLAGRPSDLIGLIAFGGFVEARSPLTLDHSALVAELAKVEVAQPRFNLRSGGAPYLQEEQATALGDAVAVAVDRLKDVKAKSRVIILLSDGRQTAGAVQPAEAAEAARAFGVRVYSIGVGTAGAGIIPGIDTFGRPIALPRNFELDEPTLRMLAETTGGRYFHAQDTQALEGVYGEIDRLEKTLAEGRRHTQYRELYLYPMLAGLTLVLVEILLTTTRFRSLP